MDSLNKRWLLIGWSDGQPIMWLNGQARAYTSFKQALKYFDFFNRKWTRDETPSAAGFYHSRWVVQPRSDSTNRIVELTFTDEGVTGVYVSPTQGE